MATVCAGDMRVRDKETARLGAQTSVMVMVPVTIWNSVKLKLSVRGHHV